MDRVWRSPSVVRVKLGPLVLSRMVAIDGGDFTAISEDATSGLAGSARPRACDCKAGYEAWVYVVGNVGRGHSKSFYLAQYEAKVWRARGSESAGRPRRLALASTAVRSAARSRSRSLVAGGHAGGRVTPRGRAALQARDDPQLRAARAQAHRSDAPGLDEGQGDPPARRSGLRRRAARGGAIAPRRVNNILNPHPGSSTAAPMIGKRSPTTRRNESKSPTPGTRRQANRLPRGSGGAT